MKKRVLFICTGNTCRSQIAEALVNARRGDTWQAYSAGMHPGRQPSAHALQALAEIGIETEGSKPSAVDEFAGQPFDLVVTLCDDVEGRCPSWPEQAKRLHLGFPDPYLATGTEAQIMHAYRDVRDGMARRLLALLDAESWPTQSDSVNSRE